MLYIIGSSQIDLHDICITSTWSFCRSGHYLAVLALGEGVHRTLVGPAPFAFQPAGRQNREAFALRGSDKNQFNTTLFL